MRAGWAFETSGDHCVALGTVKWFNPTKGYGFIAPENGGADVFVHISAVERAGMSSLREGQKINFELVHGANGKVSAENLPGGSSSAAQIPHPARAVVRAIPSR